MKKKKNMVFIISIIISSIIIIYGLIYSKNLLKISNLLLNASNKYFGWLYLLIIPLILFYLIYLAFSKYGNIRLGDKNSRPEHSTLSWLAMLFCAGTGIGLMFWSISEPLTHYVSPPDGIISGSAEAADFAIRTSFLHWGFLPWACFAIVGLALAYFQYNKKKKCQISSILEPVIGKKNSNGKLGNLIDIFAILVSVAGVSTSLGLGCMQICGGFNYLFNVPNGKLTWFIVIILVTSAYLASAVSGINKGIKLLTKINSYLALLLLIVAFIGGPTNTMFSTFVNGIGTHISNFISDSFKINPFGDNSWIFNWRVFYWAWWIAWSPFVGMFIARISKGRTVREFIIAVIIIPALLTFVWFSVFGTMALSAAGNWSINELARIVGSPETAVFIIFGKYSIGKVLSLLVIVVLSIFFITSADSATFALSMMSSDGNLNPPNYKKIIWGIVTAIMAYVLLLSGGLKPLQTISIVAALPFLIIMILICVSVLKEFRNEKSKGEKK